LEVLCRQAEPCLSGEKWQKADVCPAEQKNLVPSLSSQSSGVTGHHQLVPRLEKILSDEGEERDSPSPAAATSISNLSHAELVFQDVPTGNPYCQSDLADHSTLNPKN